MNPASRRGAAGERAARRAFESAGVSCVVVHTEESGHAGTLARDTGAGLDAVFTLGGDGTAMDVIGALSGSARTVGILPGGTANQLARHLRIPLSIGKAVRALLGGAVERMDVGCLAGGRRFGLTAGFGMDAAMMAGATSIAKQRFGVGAYLWSGARALWRNDHIRVRATVDGDTQERECALAMIVNVGSFFGGRVVAGPGIRTDDGLLDLCMFSARTPLEGLDIVRRCAIGDFRPHRNMYFARGRAIRLETEPGAPAEADGELLSTSVLEAVAEPGGAVLLRPLDARRLPA